jgi:hypothetical protein
MGVGVRLEMLWPLNEVSLYGEGRYSGEFGYFKREQEKLHHHINLTGMVQYSCLESGKICI